MTPPATGVVAIAGSLRRYDWGSTTAIQRLLDEEPDGRPAAELWFGAHPDDPSPTGDSDLAALIATDPVRALGRAVQARFGDRLPFLVKILAAGRALSIQVHPDRAQAEAGYAREESDGIDRTAPNRTYRDPHHKPELICALGEFEALCGFRPVAETTELLAAMARPELRFVEDALRGPQPLRSALGAVLTEPDPKPAVAALTDAVERNADERLRGVRLAAEDFPGDVGILVAVLLNYVRLDAGEAIYLGAGNMHSYLRGTGVEIMANSDNVVRCGLTPKHIDVPEVLRITGFDELADPRWPDVGGTFTVPVPDFRLTRVTVDEPTGLDDPGPLIVLCVEGRLSVGDVPITPGSAAFVPAATPVTLAGEGLGFVAGADA